MQIPRYQPVRKFGFNMTPMIDVVFLLIIFFLVSSHLAKQETFQEMKLPIAASGDDEIDTDLARVTINVQADGSMMVSGRPVTKPQLGGMLSAAKENEGEEIEVRIRASRSVPWKSVEPIMTRCAKSGIFNIGFSVYRNAQE